MKKIKLLLLFATIGTIFLTGCSASYKATQKDTRRNYELSQFKIKRLPKQTFNDLTYGLETKVLTTTTQEPADYEVHELSNEMTFVGPTQKYVRSMGMVEKMAGKDYVLKITLVKIELNYRDFLATSVVLGVRLEDASGTVVFTQQVSEHPKSPYGNMLNSCYTAALEQINWNRIASFLRVEQLPSREPDKKVDGFGNTALEQMIVRWDIQSRPQGADIFWRVVSKTPDVKSTNNKYLMTTPYEATKAIDIKGLTYQTSSNVRIILRCEKDGYMPQEKEFDVRVVLDQEEISAFFRLVKEE